MDCNRYIIFDVDYESILMPTKNNKRSTSQIRKFPNNRLKNIQIKIKLGSTQHV